MDERTSKLIEHLVEQNALLLTKLDAQSEIMDNLYELVEELTIKVNNLNLPFGDGFEIT